MKIILASQSPRRKALLEQLQLDFDIIVSDIEEIVDEKLPPEDIVKSLAYQKSKNVAEKLNGEYLVIGSDTVVVIDNNILGKPKNQEEAYKMLKMLSGKEHRVITGVCVLNTTNSEYYVESDISYIKMREICEDEIISYIKSGEPLDKAGSYAIQGLAGVFVERVVGSYSGIVGLPVFLVDKLLRKFGVNIL